MDEYIKKSKILDILAEQRQFYENERKMSGDYDEINMFCGSDNALVAIEDAISDIEPEDVEPVNHAKWIKLNSTQEHYCSDCGVSFNLYAYCKNEYNYCPYCGAKMDLE